MQEGLGVLPEVVQEKKDLVFSLFGLLWEGRATLRFSSAKDSLLQSEDCTWI